MSKKEDEKEEIKIILIGDSGVGKTNLVNSVMGLSFLFFFFPTVSGSFYSK